MQDSLEIYAAVDCKKLEKIKDDPVEECSGFQSPLSESRENRPFRKSR